MAKNRIHLSEIMASVAKDLFAVVQGCWVKLRNVNMEQVLVEKCCRKRDGYSWLNYITKNNHYVTIYCMLFKYLNSLLVEETTTKRTTGTPEGKK